MHAYISTYVCLYLYICFNKVYKNINAKCELVRKESGHTPKGLERAHPNYIYTWT